LIAPPIPRQSIDQARFGAQSRVDFYSPKN
jgi:hypothetical protein